MSLVPPTLINTGAAATPSASSSSDPSSNKKLTKKQQKAQAFRDRKSGKVVEKPKKGSDKKRNEDYGDLSEMDANAIPAMEDQDLAGEARGDVEMAGVLDQAQGRVGKAKGGKADKGKGKRTGEHGEEALGGAAQLGKPGKKRKREEEEDVEMEIDGEVKAGQSKKKKKAEQKEGGEEEQEKDSKKGTRKDGKQRFILFVGNFAYTTPKEAIQKHFSACDPPPEIRLLTPKPRPGVPSRPKSKGCAFLEFKTKAGLQEALKLHQSLLDGRMINVELTAGGGGKSEARTNKLKERNKGLLTQRQKKVEIAEKSKKKDVVVPSRPDRPQRFSTTSGLDEVPVNKRTWTVGDEVEPAHRGGKKHVRGKKKGSSSSNSSPWSTGVNAIPVG
ncbi:hypothetical protein DFP72DRAFT_1057751 [Ephemerocybe angulata]|uniref:RRM domain-containing protein n=1 Tax=Ephemerocybe angulata TaxID=980116 RepID=A0A8H6IJH9_9AGAR|nr:hypothetical protein DFP72DRAFT_1057751 [Tulosesus angulatus]